MKVALIQMDVAAGQPERNFAHAAELIEQAAAEKPDVIVLPEMWNTGYDWSQADHIADVDGRQTRQLLSTMARRHDVHIIGGSVMYRDSQTGQTFNTMLVMDRSGQEVARYDKIHLFRLMDEHRYLSAGNSFQTVDINGVTVGVMICYDLHFPQLSRKLAHMGAHVLVNVAQWPTPRVNHWQTLLRARAIENQVFMIGVNRVGESLGTPFPGSSMVIDPFGEVLLTGDGQEHIYTVDLDLERVEQMRKTIPVFQDERLDLYGQ